MPGPNISKKLINSFFENYSVPSEKSILEEQLSALSNRSNYFDIFFSYSFENKFYALRLVDLLKTAGYSVYIDLDDPTLDRDNANKETAKRLSTIMDRCKCLVYLHTQASKISKWCPWELGYMSGKHNFRCANILMTDDDEEFPRQEYLEMYPRLGYYQNQETRKNDFWVFSDDGAYILLNRYILGIDPK